MSTDSLTPPTILVAEDEPAMLTLVARHLKNQGFHVLEAPDGEAAWGLAQERAPDLVVLDVMMPGMSGWDVCHKIKAHAEGGPFERTGVIMLTGIGHSLNELTSPLFQADEHLDKPFDFGDLDAAIRATLARYGKAAPPPGAAPARVDLAADEAEADEDAEAEEAAPSEARPKRAAAKKPAKKAAKKPAKRVAKKPAKKAAKKPAKKAAKKPAKKAAKKPAKKAAPKASKRGASKKAAKKSAKKAAKKPAK
jgi:DNA-binding response OmpR family regulator